jgi:hypothetical protein
VLGDHHGAHPIHGPLRPGPASQGDPMKEAITLSLMDCYAGKQLAEVMPWGGGMDGTHVGGLYLQFVEGCGYTVYELTPDEADALALALVRGAAVARQEKESPP